MRFLRLAFLVSLAAAGPSLAQDAAPGIILLEAEDQAVNKASVRRVDDPAASGGRFVVSGADYNPLFAADNPAIETTRLSYWVRVRGVSVQLKSAAADGTQTELKWSWEKSDEWKWVHLGTYDRAQLGVGFIIIRGPSPRAGAGLDAVIISTDPDFKPQAR